MVTQTTFCMLKPKEAGRLIVASDLVNKTVAVDVKVALETVTAAEGMHDRDVANLLEELARREAAGSKDEGVLSNPSLDSAYATAEMALGDNLSEIGDRIVKVIVRRLHSVICGGSGSDEERRKLADALNLSESAAIAAVTAALLPITSPLFAAPAAVIIVKEFLIPVADELCDYWDEKLKS